MSVVHTTIESTFSNSIPIGIRLFPGELRQVQYSYTEYGICSRHPGILSCLNEHFSDYCRQCKREIQSRRGTRHESHDESHGNLSTQYI